MKMLRKIAAAVVAATMMLTAAVSASAVKITDYATNITMSDIEKEAKSVSVGKSYSASITYQYERNLYKIESKATGNVTVTVTDCTAASFNVDFMDSKGEIIKAKSSTVKVGSGKYDENGNIRITRDTSKKTVNATLIYAVKKGTYYLQISTIDSSVKAGTVDFKVNYPAKAIEGYLTVQLKKGDTLQLAMGSDLTWKSSKASVAAVSSTGKITAKSAGSAVISVTNGDKVFYIKVKVTS